MFVEVDLDSSEVFLNGPSLTVDEPSDEADHETGSLGDVDVEPVGALRIGGLVTQHPQGGLDERMRGRKELGRVVFVLFITDRNVAPECRPPDVGRADVLPKSRGHVDAEKPLADGLERATIVPSVERGAEQLAHDGLEVVGGPQAGHVLLGLLDVEGIALGDERIVVDDLAGLGGVDELTHSFGGVGLRLREELPYGPLEKPGSTAPTDPSSSLMRPSFSITISKARASGRPCFLLSSAATSAQIRGCTDWPYRSIRPLRCA